MSITVNAATIVGVQATPVLVHAERSEEPVFVIDGLSTAKARETQVRVRSALATVFSEFPLRTAVSVDYVSLSQPSAIGLAIAVAAAAAHAAPHDRTTIERNLRDTVWFGNLGLDSRLQAARGLIPTLLLARDHGMGVVVPVDQLREAALVPGVRVYGAGNLAQAIHHMTGTVPLLQHQPEAAAAELANHLHPIVGIEDVVQRMRRAVEKRQHVLLIAPSGAGKTMLARRATEWLGPISPEHALEVASIHSAAGLRAVMARPFRAPHHTAAASALYGARHHTVVPGEVTLAHHGVLMLDELPEFSRAAIEGVRQAMRSRSVRVHGVVMPAGGLVVGAMSPCPCGYHQPRVGSVRQIGPIRCACTPEQIQRWRERMPRNMFEVTIAFDADGLLENQD